MDEIRFVAGPIVQRYLDKVEADRQAILKAQEEAAAAKKAELEAKRAADAEAKKAAEPKDEEMKDADTVKPNAVEEPAEEKKG